MAKDVQAIYIRFLTVSKCSKFYETTSYCARSYVAEISFLYLNLPCICSSTDGTISTHTHTR